MGLLESLARYFVRLIARLDLDRAEFEGLPLLRQFTIYQGTLCRVTFFIEQNR